MFRISNNLVGVLNFITFLLSIPILWTGIWLARQGTTQCDKFLDKPVIILGLFLMLVSLAGILGACCRVSWLLWAYLFVMSVLIVVLFAFTVFAFVVTNKGAGRVLSDRGYKEYRLGDYSHWLQNRVGSAENWSKIRSCLIDGEVCSLFFADIYGNDTAQEFYMEKLNPIQSGCCKPSNDCDFEYISPTMWNNTATNSPNPDCKLWGNDPKTLCFNCQACKASFVDKIKSNWKKVAIVNIVFLVFLIIVYSVGCCAFRNNRLDNNANNQPWK